MRGDDLVVFGDFLDGEKLAYFASPGERLPLEIALRVLLDVLTGVGALHGLRDASQQPLKLTHGEISPATVLFGADGVGRVLHSVTRRAPDAQAESASLPYLAPEVHTSDARDGRADVFSVGVLLWEALEGRPLSNEGDEPAGVRVRSGPLPVPAVPDKAAWAKGLASVVSKALAAAPEDRWPTAAAMAGEIRKAAGLKLAAASAASAFAKNKFGERVKERRARWEASEPSPRSEIARASARPETVGPLTPAPAVRVPPAPAIAAAPFDLATAETFSVPAARSEEYSSPILDSFPPPPAFATAPAVAPAPAFAPAPAPAFAPAPAPAFAPAPAPAPAPAFALESVPDSAFALESRPPPASPFADAHAHAFDARARRSALADLPAGDGVACIDARGVFLCRGAGAVRSSCRLRRGRSGTLRVAPGRAARRVPPAAGALELRRTPGSAIASALARIRRGRRRRDRTRFAHRDPGDAPRRPLGPSPRRRWSRRRCPRRCRVPRRRPRQGRPSPRRPPPRCCPPARRPGRTPRRRLPRRQRRRGRAPGRRRTPRSVPRTSSRGPCDLRTDRSRGRPDSRREGSGPRGSGPHPPPFRGSMSGNPEIPLDSRAFRGTRPLAQLVL